MKFVNSDDLISPKDIKVIQITDGNIDPYVFKTTNQKTYTMKTKKKTKEVSN